MYSKKYVIPLIIIFILAAFAPAIYNSSAGTLGFYPEIEKPEGYCVHDPEWMASNHMLLLQEWRINAIRFGAEGGRIYHSPYGIFHASTNTCWECHDKEKFCDVCHEYVAIHPECWDCHVTPELKEEKIVYKIEDIKKLFETK